ncbi:CBS domain-containing protein [Catenovulum maritimum]|uniref:Histidine kinase n=1 Tax=Catenovulum maritimum TaxID=1513271 RepID=A0A0J8GZG5_9ALTE|nr:CBS domain-containing protein [Catenovulum maritimum]KMT66118.1 histidine kinase [Catenovulum maritimum]
MKNLALSPLEHSDHLVQPEEFEEINLKSAALAIFTDFKKHKPLMIDSHTSAQDVAKDMKRSHVKMKLVVDRDKEFVGLISFDDIAAQNVTKLVANGYPRSEVSASTLMTPRHLIRALSFEDIEKSTIGDLVHTLKRNGVQHCLVVDQANHHIRGLISASDIARKLKLNISIEEMPSFADIFQAVRGDLIH